MYISHFHQAGSPPLTVSWGSYHGENTMCFQRFCLKSTDLLELEACLSLAHPPSPRLSLAMLEICLCARVQVCVCAQESSIVGPERHELLRRCS